VIFAGVAVVSDITVALFEMYSPTLPAAALLAFVTPTMFGWLSAVPDGTVNVLLALSVVNDPVLPLIGLPVMPSDIVTAPVEFEIDSGLST
jgi:hypothetical protein